jgi:hypothetical protein
MSKFQDAMRRVITGDNVQGAAFYPSQMLRVRLHGGLTRHLPEEAGPSSSLLGHCVGGV